MDSIRKQLLKKILKWGLLCFGLLCVTVVLYLLDAMLNNSSKRLDSSAKVLVLPSSSVGGYDWLSETKVFYLYVTNADYEVACYDYLSKEKWLLTNVSAAIRSYGVNGNDTINWLLSSDKSKVLIIANPVRPRLHLREDEEDLKNRLSERLLAKSAYFVISLKDGKVVSPSMRFSGYKIAWESNSQGWVEFTHTRNGMLMRRFRIDSPNDFKEFSISNDLGNPLGFDQDGNLISYALGQSQSEIMICKARVASSTIQSNSLHKTYVSFPVKPNGYDVVFVPSKDMIMWLLSVGSGTHGHVDVWSSNTIGKNKRYLGYLPSDDVYCVKYNVENGGFSFLSNRGIYLIGFTNMVGGSVPEK